MDEILFHRYILMNPHLVGIQNASRVLLTIQKERFWLTYPAMDDMDEERKSFGIVHLKDVAFNGQAGIVKFTNGNEIRFEVEPEPEKFNEDTTEHTRTAINLIKNLRETTQFRKVAELTCQSLISKLDDFFTNLSARNYEYWAVQSGFSCDNMIAPDRGKNPEEVRNLVRELFTDGIKQLMCEKVDVGRKKLTVANDIMNRMGSQSCTTETYSQMFFLHAILFDTEVPDTLDHACQYLEKDLYQAMMRFETRDLYEVYLAIARDNMTDEAHAAANTFPLSTTDNYCYEYFGDTLVRLARLAVIGRQFNRAHLIALQARKCYEVLMKKNSASIPSTDITGKILHSNVRLFNAQAVFLENYASLLKTEKRDNLEEMVRALQEFFDRFYNTYLNPPNKKESHFSMLEELEWVFIYKSFALLHLGIWQPGQDEVLRKYLG